MIHHGFFQVINFFLLPSLFRNVRPSKLASGVVLVCSFILTLSILRRESLNFGNSSVSVLTL